MQKFSLFFLAFLISVLGVHCSSSEDSTNVQFKPLLNDWVRTVRPCQLARTLSI